jgi:hypothetical protein
MIHGKMFESFDFKALKERQRAGLEQGGKVKE